MKSYTDLEQSIKLAEILPLESADMYCPNRNGIDNYPLPIEWKNGLPLLSQEIPCWSLSALLEAIPDSIYDNTDEFSQLEFSKRSVAYHDLNDGIKIGSLKDNLIDACVDMIIKLKENNLI